MRPEILDRAEALGHRVFVNGIYNVNIIGVRSSSRIAGRYDDTLHVVFKDSQHNWVDLTFIITTDAGLFYLENPSKPVGTAILVAGQYRGVYQIGLHRGQYEALVQRGGKVKVYRDNNRDSILDHDEETQVEGYFGINIHRSGTTREATNVHRWSAGCQVFCNAEDFDIFMAICRKSSKLYGNSFTYTLIEDE